MADLVQRQRIDIVVVEARVREVALVELDLLARSAIAGIGRGKGHADGGCAVGGADGADADPDVDARGIGYLHEMDVGDRGPGREGALDVADFGRGELSGKGRLPVSGAKVKCRGAPGEGQPV